MATVTITNNNNRRDSFDGTPSGDANIGGGPAAGNGAPANELPYQGTSCWLRRINSTGVDFGWAWTSGSTIDMTVDDDRAWICKAIMTNPDALGALTNVGNIKIRLGSQNNAYNDYWISDEGSRGEDQPVYPAKKGWVIIPIDPNVTAWIDEQTGNPAETAIDYFGITGNVGNTSNAPNLGLDAVDIGPGYYVVGGDGTDSDASWDDIVDTDENDTTNGRIGHITTQEGVIFTYGAISVGKNNAGTSTATEWTDSLKSIVFPGGRVAEGWNSVHYDLTLTTQSVSESSMSYSGQGRTQTKRYFDAQNEVNGGTNQVTISGHGLKTGQAVLYSNEGGTQSFGLTNNTEYFIINSLTDSIQLATNRLNAFAGTAISLSITPTVSTENHSFTLQPDTRPNLSITGASGAAAFNGNAYVKFNTFDLDSAGNFSNCLFVESQKITLNDGNLSSCTITDPTISEGESFVTAGSFNELAGVSSCLFSTMGKGHALELSTTAGSGTLSDNVFTGYKPDPSGATAGTGWAFDNQTEVDSTSVQFSYPHGISSGDSFYYEVQSNGNIGLTDGGLYYLQSVDSSTVSVHQTEYAAANGTNTIALTIPASGGENSFYSSNAAFHNSTGGSVTLNITGGTSPGVRNSGGSTTTVVNSVSVTLSGLKDDSEVRVYETGTTIEVAGIETATDGSPDDRSFTFSDSPGDQIDIVVLALKYKWLKLINVTVPNDNTTIPIQQIIDRNYIQ